jgi:tRNA splicing ligase
MSTIKFRPQRSTFNEAMLEAVEIPASKEALLKHLNAIHPFICIRNYKVEDISIAKRGVDKRNGWDTYSVTIKNLGCIGFINSSLES